MLSVRGLATLTLRDVEFDLRPGECVAVHGPSGSGKSLLLRALADLDPSRGTVRLDGVERQSLPGPEWRRRVRYLAAEPGWWAERVREHFPDWTAAVPLVRRLGLPDDVGEAAVLRLSTGERQRLALVRALARPPRVLLADEPTAALDAASAAAVEALVAELSAAGMMVLWVGHDPAQTTRVASRALRIDGDRLLPES